MIRPCPGRGSRYGTGEAERFVRGSIPRPLIRERKSIRQKKEKVVYSKKEKKLYTAKTTEGQTMAKVSRRIVRKSRVRVYLDMVETRMEEKGKSSCKVSPDEFARTLGTTVPTEEVWKFTLSRIGYRTATERIAEKLETAIRDHDYNLTVENTGRAVILTRV